MFEVDYLWVGENEKTGDAIACRFTRPDTGELAVVVIDGGFADTGERMVEHIRTQYHTDRVDLVVCTHPDNDHIMGLFTVIDELIVDRLLIHRPSEYGYGADDDVKADLVDDLVRAAQAEGTVVESSFAGTTFLGGALTVLGPSEALYEELLSQQASWDRKVSKVSRTLTAGAKSVRRSVRSLFKDPGETMTDDNGGTSPRNNTSVILNLTVGAERVLFTGDAGVPALSAAADLINSLALSATPLSVFDVPHHGSRHNLTPELLDQILGSVVGDADRRGHAIASVGKQADDHPRPEVANAVRRRGFPVYCTRGVNLWWPGPDPQARDNYAGTVDPMPWLEEGD